MADCVGELDIDWIERRAYRRVKQPSGGRADLPTCSRPFWTHLGHYAYIKLVLPVFHIGYFKQVITMLQDICKVNTASSL